MLKRLINAQTLLIFIFFAVFSTATAIFLCSLTAAKALSVVKIKNAMTVIPAMQAAEKNPTDLDRCTGSDGHTSRSRERAC